MATDAITVEGGLFAADLLERMAAEPDAIEGQKPAHFNQSGRLSEEIQSTFSAARRYWETFQSRRRRSRNGITTLTREHWARPLLEDLLGYRLTYQRAAVQVGGTSFPISHRAGDDPDAPPVHAVGIHHHLDRRADEEPRSPHALVQDYLNRTDPLWGVVTNCSRLRLLRGSARFARPTHVEFDLEAMVEQSLYSEFVFFYRLAHRTRLPKAAADVRTSAGSRSTTSRGSTRAAASANACATASSWRSKRSAPASSPTRPTTGCATRSGTPGPATRTTASCCA